MPERRTGHELLARITENPQLARAVPHLRPEILHAVIVRQGLQDCGELLALATAEQLSAVFDIDLWKAPRGGDEERFDDARFREWIDVLVDTDPVLAAERLAQMDVGLVVNGLSPSIAVLDAAVFSPAIEVTGADPFTTPGSDRGVHADIGGFVVVARRTDRWGAIVEALHSLAEHHPRAFRRVMRGCRALSDSGRELDGCDDLMSHADQARFDLAVSRELRRERLGFLLAQQAHAFLEAARHTSLAAETPHVDPIFAAYRRGLREAADTEPSDSGCEAAPHATEPGDEAAAAVADLIDELRESGVLTDAPRALLGAPADEQSAANRALTAYLRLRAERDDPAGLATSQELGFLTNALVAGSSLQGRALTIKAAQDAVAATCNLGLEYWPEHWGDRAPHDLVTIFRVGSTVLHHDVCVAASRRLLSAVDGMTSTDRALQMGLCILDRELRQHLRRATPWRARDALDVLTTLDLPTWAALLGLIDQCPVLLANVTPQGGRPARTVNPSEFRFVASSADVAAVHAFLATLAERLTA